MVGMPAFANLPLDFGYPWWLSYGHLAILAPAVALLLFGYVRGWSQWPMTLLSVLALWSCAGFAVARLVIDVNSPGTLPTQSFLRSGTGRVLDLGAGTGRSSIMVLEARPQTTLVALDLFAESFDRHFGHGASPQQRLQANLKAAGVEQRATIQTGDMRKLPFEGGTFDAAVSMFAVDHLRRTGITEALAEAARVVKPGGDFLLIVLAKDLWSQFAFGPLLIHSGARGPEWWSGQMKDAGFQVVEVGTPPAALYVLAQRKWLK